MNTGVHRSLAVAGWVGVLIPLAGFAAIAWRGFGLTLLVRVMAGAMVVIVILLQLALLHLRRGAVLHGAVTVVSSVAVAVGSYYWLPQEQLVRAPSLPEQTTDDTPTATATGTSLPSALPAPEQTSPGGYASLPNAKRYDCSARIHPRAAIAKFEQGFNEENWRPRLLQLLKTRYPDAHSVVRRLAQPTLFDVWFRGGRGDWAQAMTELSTGVHEASHMVDIAARKGREHVLVLAQDKELRFPIPKTFHRSDIRETLPPVLEALSYTQTYLTEASGAQGFEMVLEEQNAYTYSVLTSVAVVDQLPGNMSTSTRDGLMVFMYYVEAYLRLARTMRPDTYGAISGSKALRSAVVQLNDRAECALSLTAGHDNLGIADQEIWPHVFGAEALGEVARLRAASAQ